MKNTLIEKMNAAVENMNKRQTKYSYKEVIEKYEAIRMLYLTDLLPMEDWEEIENKFQDDVTIARLRKTALESKTA